MQFKEKYGPWAIIAGAAEGLGEAWSRALAQRGMNLIMVDITDIPGVRLYDTATIIGRDGDERNTADTHAGWCQSINYEILSRLSPLLPRYII